MKQGYFNKKGIIAELFIFMILSFVLVILCVLYVYIGTTVEDALDLLFDSSFRQPPILRVFWWVTMAGMLPAFILVFLIALNKIKNDRFTQHLLKRGLPER